MTKILAKGCQISFKQAQELSFLDHRQLAEKLAPFLSKVDANAILNFEVPS